LVISIPTPACDHRQRQDPALAQQVLIGAWIVPAHLFRHMRDVELDRPTAASLQVCEQQPVLRPEQVARMRLAVERLLGSVPLTDRPRRLSQRVAQELAVRIPKIRGSRAVADQRLRFRDAIREVGRNEIGLSHAGVQPFEGLRIIGWCDVSVGHRLVVAPQGDHEAVTQVDARRRPRIERGYRTIGFGEPTSDLDFELCASLALDVRDPSENVARPQANSEPVRVVENDGVIDPQIQCRGRRHSRTDRGLNS
jgi:hypothetical protein